VFGWGRSEEVASHLPRCVRGGLLCAVTLGLKNLRRSDLCMGKFIFFRFVGEAYTPSQRLQKTKKDHLESKHKAPTIYLAVVTLLRLLSSFEWQ
jgi:hypothetical protein